MRHSTHHQVPEPGSVRLILCYKNFAAAKNISHIGLGVAARNTAATLRKSGLRTDVWPITSGQDLINQIQSTQAKAIAAHEHPISHVVISAPWVPTATLQKLCMDYPDIVFVVSSHSNIGFLQADTNGMQLLRDSYNMAIGSVNFKTAGNCKRYSDWVTKAYGVPCLYLPNLYDLSNTTTHPYRQPSQAGVLRIGCFGAQRPLKNLMTSAAAALEVGKRLNRDVEISMSGGREEGGGTGVLNSIRAMLTNVPRVTFKQLGWASWPEFRRCVASMDILLQPSYTESFNMVTADGIAEGICSVTSDAIDWVPTQWQAACDDVSAIADKAIALLYDNHAPKAGLDCLKRYIDDGLGYWQEFLLNIG